MKTNKERLEFIKSLPGENWCVVYDENFSLEGGRPDYVGPIEESNGAMIGVDGFGYEWDGERLIKFPHRGDVIIGKDVEIGANTCIARASVEGEATVIREGTKIDNLTHIAHNCKIGRHCLIGANVTIGGSVQIGDRVSIWGSVYIEHKLKIGNDAEIRAGSAIFTDVGPGEVWAGNPAKLIFKKNDKR